MIHVIGLHHLRDCSKENSWKKKKTVDHSMGNSDFGMSKLVAYRKSVVTFRTGDMTRCL